MVRMTDHEEKETQIINSNFSFEYKGFHVITFDFRKENYRSHREFLRLEPSGFSKAPKTENIKQNLNVTLKEIGKLSHGVINRNVTLRQNATSDRIKRQGWSSDKYREKFFEFPSEVDIFVSFDSNGNPCLKADGSAGLYLIESSSVGFDPLHSILAPEKSYVDSVELHPADGSNYVAFLYFRTKKGTYGKMKIISISVRGQNIYLYSTCYINTTGRRDLNTIAF